MKPKYLYHGTTKKILGKNLLPRKAKDLSKNPKNMHKAVYATNKKDIAIAMALISCKGVNYSSLSFNHKPYGAIYIGWPNQKYIYLYILPSKTFKKMGGNGRQYASYKPVKPIAIKTLRVKNYINLIRKTTKKEKTAFFKKRKIKINLKRLS
jgi:hypothetical protein